MTSVPEATVPSRVDEADRWRALAALLSMLLAGSRERYAAERDSDRATHYRSLLQDREGFLDLVAHELKTPVAIIRAYAELLDAQLGDQLVTPEARQVVGTILEQADLMTEVIEGVLDVQRLRLGKLPLETSRVDLVQLAQAVAAEVQQTTRRHAIRVVAPDPSPPLWADRRRLRQVLLNLIDNAVKYSSGGEIEIHVSADQTDALVAVRDQGIGLEPDELGRIFEQFEQVSSAPIDGRVGLGLGLYIARQIARAHGGEIWAESGGKNRGSTFYVRLPLEAAPAG